MNTIGYMYEYGEGVQSDINLALAWYEKAANLGNTTAMNNLGYNSRFGKENLTADLRTAFYWYKQSAEAGDADAMNIVGLMYDNGEYV